MSNSLMIIGCIQVLAYPSAPTDQINPTIEECPDCKEEMWVSDKKRDMRDTKSMRCICMLCALKETGSNVEIIDIIKVH